MELLPPAWCGSREGSDIAVTEPEASWDGAAEAAVPQIALSQRRLMFHGCSEYHLLSTYEYTVDPPAAITAMALACHPAGMRRRQHYGLDGANVGVDSDGLAAARGARAAASR